MAFQAKYRMVDPIRNSTEFTTMNQALEGIRQIQSYPGRHSHLSRVEMEMVGGVGFGQLQRYTDCQSMCSWKRAEMHEQNVTSESSAGRSKPG